MADNVFKGVIDAIAESDNELAGQLLTRISESHVHGREDGQLTTAAATQLTSPVSVFKATDVGKGIDFIEPIVGAATGFEGSYLVATFVDAYNVTLTKIDGSAPSFTDTDPIRWRFTTLRVETTLDFPTKDRQMQLWIGEEAEPIPYSEIVQVPGGQEFRGLGGHRLSIQGIIDAGAPATLTHEGAYFTADAVGKALWVLPEATPNGNEGPQLITAVASDGTSATVSPGGFAADQEIVWFHIKDYDSDKSYLTGLRPPSLERRALQEQSPVTDGSQSYSGIDRLRRALLVDYATEEELDRIGRNLAVTRPLGIDDEQFRCLLKTLSYLPKGTEYALELVLECLFPGGQYEIYEDLANFPNRVFIEIEDIGGDSTEFEGKTYMAPGPVDSGPAADQSPGRGGRELVTTTTATSMTLGTEPITVQDVLRAPVLQQLDMDVLPSADSPAWTYQAQNSATEGTIFTLGGDGTLTNVMGGTDNGGRYITTGLYPEPTDGSVVSVQAWFRASSITDIDDLPWGLAVEDTGIDASYGLFWSDNAAKLASDATSAGLGSFTIASVVDGDWHLMELRRETIGDKHFISAKVDGVLIYGRAYLSTETAFQASPTQDSVRFGYDYLTGTNQDWTVHWDQVRVLEHSTRNFFNSYREDGVFAGTDAVLQSASSAWVAGDVGKHVRIHSSADQRARGLWEIAAFNSGTAVELQGIASDEIVAVASVVQTGVGDDITPSASGVLLYDPNANFPAELRGGKITIAGATNPTNNGTFDIIARVDSTRIYIDNSAAVLETGGAFTWELLVNSVTLDDSRFTADDVGKAINISGSAIVPVSNDGDRIITAFISAKVVHVDGVEFQPELQLVYQFKPYDGSTIGLFAADTGVSFETVGTGGQSGSIVTTRDPLPLANTDVAVSYTSVLSAQIMRNEFVTNDGAAGSEPNIFYPFYIFDVDRATRQLLDEITAAGVIPSFEREF